MIRIPIVYIDTYDNTQKEEYKIININHIVKIEKATVFYAGLKEKDKNLYKIVFDNGDVSDISEETYNSLNELWFRGNNGHNNDCSFVRILCVCIYVINRSIFL